MEPERSLPNIAYAGRKKLSPKETHASFDAVSSAGYDSALALPGLFCLSSLENLLMSAQDAEQHWEAVVAIYPEVTSVMSAIAGHSRNSNSSSGFKLSMTRRTATFASVTLIALASLAAAQTMPKPAAQQSGLTAYLQFGGTANSDGQVYALSPSAGYDFNSHFGIAVGAPVYFVRPSSSTGSAAASGLGDPFLGLHLQYPNETLNFATFLTGTAPIGNSKEGLSTGRATVDWTSHIDHRISRLTPFLEAGLANTTPDSSLFLRPYTTLGFNAHFRGGASYAVRKFVSVGASGYDILPSGNQTIFSRVPPAQANGGNGQHGPSFLNSQQTTGSSSLAQDDGFSTWIEAFAQRTVDLQLGFTRSFVYNLNSVSFNIGINLRQFYRSSQN